MTTPAGSRNEIADAAEPIYSLWSAHSANYQGEMITGLAQDDDYAFIVMLDRFRYAEHPDDTGDRFSSRLSDRYHQLATWWGPKLDWQMGLISVTSGTNVVDDHWPDRPYVSGNDHTYARDLSIDAGLVWQTSGADSAETDSSTVPTQRHAAHNLVPQEPAMLAEAVRHWLTHFYEDEWAELLAETLNNRDIDQNLGMLGDSGARELADRFRFLLTGDDEEEDDDVPLSVEAALGFFDFINEVEYEGIPMSATCAHGRLCTQWKYEDGRSLVLWFKNRSDTVVTAFGSDRKLLKGLGRDHRASNVETATKLLVEANFFTWRRDRSN